MMAEQKKIKTPNEKAQATQLSLKDYQAFKKQSAKKESKAFRLPAPVKWILAIPLLIIFLFGIFYIPYLLINTERSPSLKTQKNK
jgi:hypothetical protein